MLQAETIFDAVRLAELSQADKQAPSRIQRET
jgi:hypothetical protein